MNDQNPNQPHQPARATGVNGRNTPGGLPGVNGGKLTTAELYELASLDALGLLDEHERKVFEDAFSSATPGVRSQIRATQRRMAEIDEILPRVQPRPSLKAKVLAAIEAAISKGLAPSSVSAAAGEDVRTHAAGRNIAGRIGGAGPALLPSRGVHPLWRAAAIGSIAAALLLAVVTLSIRQEFTELDSANRSAAMTNQLIKEFGPRFERALLAPKTQFVQFSASDESIASQAGMAVLVLDPTTKTGQFFAKHLPEQVGGTTYNLVVIAPDGSRRNAVLNFIKGGSNLQHNELRNFEMPAGSTLAITPAGATDRPILRSSNL